MRVRKQVLLRCLMLRQAPRVHDKIDNLTRLHPAKAKEKAFTLAQELSTKEATELIGHAKGLREPALPHSNYKLL